MSWDFERCCLFNMNAKGPYFRRDLFKKGIVDPEVDVSRPIRLLSHWGDVVRSDRSLKDLTDLVR